LAVSVGCSGPVAGWLLDRFEARFVMGFGAALAGGGLIAASRSGTFPELLAADILMGVGLGLSSWLPASVVIANWFGDRRGTAMGLATAGMESGGMAMTFAAGYIIGRFNWSTAYLALSLPILILVLPLLVTIVRTRPEVHLPGTPAESSRMALGYEVADAIKTRVFWMLVVAQITWGLSVGVFMHIISYLMTLGYSLQFATTAVAVSLGLIALGEPTMGALGDRIGGRNALGIALLLYSASILVLLNATKKWAIVLFMALYGLSGAAPVALVPLVLAETLGLRRFGSLYGWIQPACYVGFFAGPLIVGRLYDLNHSYSAGFELSAAFLVVGSVAAFLCTEPYGFNE